MSIVGAFHCKFVKPDSSDKRVYLNTEKYKTGAYRSKKMDKTLENIIDESDSQRISTSMACMSSNVKISRINYGDSSQLTNLILESSLTCHMTPDISDFIPGLFLETDKYIEVVDWNFITVKKPGQVQI